MHTCSHSEVGGARGWTVRGVYQKLNSVAVISTREAVRAIQAIATST